MELKEKRELIASGLDAFDLALELTPAKGGESRLRVRGLDITYDAAKGTLTCGRVTAPLKPRDGRVSLRVLVDRGSVELFADGGAVAISVAPHRPRRRPHDHGDWPGGDRPPRLVADQVGLEMKRCGWPVPDPVTGSASAPRTFGSLTVMNRTQVPAAVALGRNSTIAFQLAALQQ